MEYFFISQDRKYKNTPAIQDFYEHFSPNLFCLESGGRIPERNIVYAQSRTKLDFVDVLSGPVLLVSDLIKRVMEAYDEALEFKMFFILNTLGDQGELYYAPLLKRIRHVELSERGRNTVWGYELSQIEQQPICQISAELLSKGMVANLEIAESLLRRGCKGIHYQRMEVKNGRIYCKWSQDDL